MYLVAVVGPGSELHFAVLVVKGEPSDVYLACALEDARRDVQATAVMRDHHVCLERPVETLLRTTRLVIVRRLNEFHHLDTYTAFFSFLFFYIGLTSHFFLFLGGGTLIIYLNDQSRFLAQSIYMYRKLIP